MSLLKRLFLSSLITVHCSLLTAALSAACPMCAVGSSDIAERYSASVALLSYLPIGVTAVLGLLIYRSVRRR